MKKIFPPVNCCGAIFNRCRATVTRPRSLADVVNLYIRYCRSATKKELQPFAEMKSIKRRISEAVFPDTKFPHQYLIPNSVLKEAERSLLAVANRLARAKSFDSDLLPTIEEIVLPIKGIGKLAAYDFAVRIGAGDIEPTKIYLHRGTRAGAKHFGLRGSVIETNELPREFARLSAREIEDCLCIFADDIGRILMKSILYKN